MNAHDDLVKSAVLLRFDVVKVIFIDRPACFHNSTVLQLRSGKV